MKTSFKRIAVATICVLTLAGLSSCNTVRGVGKDIQRGGEAIEGAATNTQQKMQSSVDRKIALSVKSGVSLKTFQVSVNRD